jgi:acyl carrier protein
VDSTAEVIADVWRDLLGVATFGPDDDFLALGGDSLIAVRIAARLRQRLGCELAPSAVFREGTVARLTRLLSTELAAPGPAQNGKLTELREEGWL